MSGARTVGLLKVVLDTNVYISAFHGVHGVPFQLWRRAVKQEYLLLISPAIIREVADVLRTTLAWPEFEIVAQLKLIVRVAEIVEPKLRLT